MYKDNMDGLSVVNYFALVATPGMLTPSAFSLLILGIFHRFLLDRQYSSWSLEL